MSKRVFKTELDAVNNSLQAQVNNSISKTIVDAKGDIVTASAADTPARLAVGANGYALVADSTTTTGLSYGTSALANPIINGGMDIWQRGTSFTANGYSADRWYAQATGGTQTYSRSTDVPSNFTYSFSIASTTATNPQIYTRIEAVNSTPLAGRTVTISFYAKSTSGTSALRVYTSYAGAVDNWSTSFQDIDQPFTLTSSWARYSHTYTVTANATNGYNISLYRADSSASSTTLITGVQIDLGSTALPFRRSGGTLAGELAACQRYLPAHYVGNSTLGIIGQATGTGTAYYTAPFAVQPRVAPTGITISSGTLKAGTSTFGDGGGTGVFNSAQLSQGQIIVTGASGLTAGHATYIYPSATATILWTGCEL